MDSDEQESTYFITPQSFKAVFVSQNEDQTLSKDISQVLVLKNNKILIYMYNGEYILYSMLSQSVIGQGIIESNIKKLYYIEESLIAFLSFVEKKLKVLDLKQNLVLAAFGPQFPSLSALPKQQRNDNNIESLFRDTQIISLPGPSTQKYYNILVQETKASYQSEFDVVYSILQFPKNILDLTAESNNIRFQCQYKNVKEQRQMFGTMLDEDTAAFYGQDFEPEQYEFVLCRPKLGNLFLNIVYIPQPSSLVLMQITTWDKGQLGIWFNNNDSSGQTCVDILNYEVYFDVPDLNVQQIKNLYAATRKPLIFDNDVDKCNPIEAILSEVDFVGKGYALIERLIGPCKFFFIINRKKNKVIYSTIINNTQTINSQDGAYYLQFNNYRLIPDQLTQDIDFWRYSILDYKFYFIKLINETKIFDEDQQLNTSLTPDLFDILFF